MQAKRSKRVTCPISPRRSPEGSAALSPLLIWLYFVSFRHPRTLTLLTTRNLSFSRAWFSQLCRHNARAYTHIPNDSRTSLLQLAWQNSLSCQQSDHAQSDSFELDSHKALLDRGDAAYSHNLPAHLLRLGSQRTSCRHNTTRTSPASHD